MLTGEIRSQIDQVWNAFWSGGISNPLEVIEQITYLLFLKRLDEQEIAEELKANREKKPMQKRFFPEGKDNKKRSFQDYRWNRFKNTDPRDMYVVVSEHVFPWLRTLGGNGTTYSKHMEGARFTIPTPALLAKVVDMIDKVPMEDRDTKGDLYEYSRPGGSVVFDFRLGRGRDGPKRFLGQFEGILQTDGYAAYDQIGGPRMIHAACWAHYPEFGIIQSESIAAA